MKKTIRLVCTIIAAIAMLCAAFALVACGDESDITDLRVENAKISFMCGDEFETGESFTVYALYKDGREVDVTKDVSVRQESGMDMNVASDYQITVIYGEKRTIYTVYVNDREDVVRKIDPDVSAVKTQYKLGEKFSTDGLVLNLVYENAHGVTFPATTTSLNGFDVTVANSSGVEIDEVFTALGSFTVTVSKGNVKGSFDVTVEGVDISSVPAALTVGTYYSSTVASGRAHIQGARMNYNAQYELQPGEPFTSAIYEYSFGNNYTYFRNTHDNPTTEYHCSIDESGLFVTFLEDGVIKTSNMNNAAMMNGSPYILWYNSEIEYGIENALNNLYSHALRCSNDDFVPTADEATRSYSFEFSGLEFRDNSGDFYKTTVEFTLGEDYAIASVSLTQDYYENNSSLAGQEGYVPTFTTDPVTGKTTPGATYSYRTIITVSQTTGERTAQNEYDRNMFKVSSYTLSYNGTALADGAVLECSAGNTYVLQISDVLPATANLAVDIMQFDYEGNLEAPDFWLSNEHFTIVRDNNRISLSTRHGGTWTLLFTTARTTRRLTVHITGEPPEDMQPKLYNNVSGAFYDGSEKTVGIGGAVYFYGAVDRYADSAQTATIDSDNAAYATITAATLNGVACWKFTATQAGSYQISVVSDSMALVRCIFVFTVSEAADFSTLLSGTYTVQDQVGNIYTVAFTQTGADPLGGTVLVTCTPTDDSNNPITEEATRQTLSFYVDGMQIVVTHGASDTIWVEFDVDQNNNLVLIDRRDTHYVLTRA